MVDQNRDPYKPHSRFVAPAHNSGPPLRLLGAAFGIDFLWLLAAGAVFGVMAPSLALGDTRPGLMLGLLFFVLLVAITASVARRLHDRHWLTLFGALWRVGPDMLRTTFACVLLIAIIHLLLSGGTEPQTEMRPLAGWLAFLPVLLFGLMVQTGAEELLYRGYLQQQTAALFPHPIVWLVFPSLWFGLAHLDLSQPGAEMWAYVLWATVLGIACADLTARTGSIGAAWGLHLANNIFAVCFVADKGGSWSAGALFLLPESSALESAGRDLSEIIWGTGFEIFLIWLLWLAARNAIRR